MKEDVLEQIVDDYLQFKGYFATHNVRFRSSGPLNAGTPSARPLAPGRHEAVHRQLPCLPSGRVRILARLPGVPDSCHRPARGRR